MSTATSTETKWFPVEFKGWACNGSVDPLIRNTEHLRAICNGDPAELAECARWCAIAMQAADNWPYKAEPVALVEETLAKWFAGGNRRHGWATRKEITPGAKTIAQVIAQHGGTDSRAGCENSTDLARATELIGSYNEFDAAKFISELRGFNLRQYYNPGNPNNGGDLFKYHVGWECSHVVYIRLSTPSRLTCRALNSGGDQWRNYSPIDFIARCSGLAHNTKADESALCEQDQHGITWRLWWD